MKKVMKLSWVLVLMVLMFSCSDDGADGAVGPAGAQGTTGTQGDPGTANVIYSDWIPNVFPNAIIFLKDISTPLATAEEITALGVDLDTSVVLVYGKGDVSAASGSSGDEVVPLPYENIDEGELYTFAANNGVRALAITTDGVIDNGFDDFSDFRYIIIPGGVPVDKSRSMNEYKNMSYEEIAALFNIPE